MVKCPTCWVLKGHQCIECNNRYESVDELVKHQKRRNHFGGHYVKDAPRQGVAPVAHADFDNDDSENEDGDDEMGEAAERAERLAAVGGDESLADLPVAEVDGVDGGGGVNGGGAVGSGDGGGSERDGERDEDVILLPDLPAADRKRKRGQDASDAAIPSWVKTARGDTALVNNITFHAEEGYKFFTCRCSPGIKRATGGNLSNVRKHLQSSACSSKPGQLTLFGDNSEKPMTQSWLDDLVVNCVISCNMPFNTVEKEDFRNLVLKGRGRAALKVLSRRTLVRRIDDAYEEVKKEVGTLARHALGKIAVTMDGWTDRGRRNFEGFTIHFFDKSFMLRTFTGGLVANSNGGTAGNIADIVSGSLRDVVGEDWKECVGAFVTDGAPNVVAAARQLGVHRRCVQHRLQLLFKHFCTTQQDIADALAVANYLAKLSGISAAFHNAVGAIQSAVPTRWLSYTGAARDVYNRRSKITAFADEVQATTVKVRELIVERAESLRRGGFRVLHDLCILGTKLGDVITTLEGDTRTTTSAAVPLLLRAKREIDQLFARCTNYEISDENVGVLDRKAVATWQGVFTACFDKYVSPILSDDALLTATALDPSRGLAAFNEFPDVKARAASAFKRAISEQRDKVVAARRVVDLHESSPVASADENNTSADLAEALGVDLPGGHNGRARAVAEREVKTLEAELRDFVECFAEYKPEKNDAVGPDLDPIKFYKVHYERLPFARAVALDLFAIPVGEAPAERVFSTSTRVCTFDRLRITPANLAKVTFIKRNRKELGRSPKQ